VRQLELPRDLPSVLLARDLLMQHSVESQTFQHVERAFAHRLVRVTSILLSRFICVALVLLSLALAHCR